MNNIRGWITVIGSRTIPTDLWELMAQASCIQMTRGFGIRSGGAAGSDEAGLQGARRSPVFDPQRLAIFLPWRAFKREDLPTLYADPAQGIYDASTFENYEQAAEISLKARGSWNGLGQGGIKLHTRNAYQPLGRFLNEPSVSVLCYAKPIGNKGQVDGGTNTAVQIAISRGIRIINIYKDEDRRIVEQLVEQHKGI